MTLTLHPRRRLAHGASLGVLISAAALTLASPALAQTASASVQNAPTVVDQVVVTATGRQAQIQDVPIAITAVTASAVANAGVTDLKALQSIVPTYHIQEGQSNAAGASALIRNIGTGGDNPGFESAVGFFIDGVYRNRTGVALSELPEVERIEVLAGPQGTLFGRNTSAGAISVTTKAPEFTERGYLNLTAGNYNERNVVAGVTGPLDANRVLAGKLEGGYERRDGYITNIDNGAKYNNRNRWNLRGQLLWDIDNDASLRVIADTAHTDEQCCSAVGAVYGSSAAAVSAVAQLNGGKGLVSPANPSAYETSVSAGRDLLEKVDEYGLSGQLDWKRGGVKVTNIAAYRDWKVLRDQDIDFSDLDRAYRQGYSDHFKTFTEELRLQGETGRLNWLVGGFYADETLDHDDKIKLGSQAAEYVDALAGGAVSGYNVYGSLGSSGCGAAQALFPHCRLLAYALYGAGVPLSVANAFADAVAATAPTDGEGQTDDHFATHTRTAALFTHDEISLTKDLVWTIGLRLNHEDKALTANLAATTGGACAVYQNPNYNALAKALLSSSLAQILLLTCSPEVNSVANGAYKTGASENALTGVSSLRYTFARNLMAYASYSRGYKAGGYNLDRGGFDITPATTVKPQASDLHFNPEFVNAYELGVKSTIFEGTTTLDANVFYEDINGYQDNAFSGYIFLTKNIKRVISRGVEVDATVRPPVARGLTLLTGLLFDEAYTGTATDFNTPGLTSSSAYIVPAGRVLPSAPKWTLTEAVTYRRMIPSTNLEGLLYLDAHYSSGYTTSALDPIAATNQRPFTLVNGRIGLGPQGGRWTAEMFARNLFNQFYYAYAFTVPEQNNHDIYPGEPRMFGGTLKLKF